jgi:hypothetical protein
VKSVNSLLNSICGAFMYALKYWNFTPTVLLPSFWWSKSLFNVLIFLLLNVSKGKIYSVLKRLILWNSHITVCLICFSTFPFGYIWISDTKHYVCMFCIFKHLNYEMTLQWIPYSHSFMALNFRFCDKDWNLFLKIYCSWIIL